ncbi:Crp/Fnr family transcriptional regulator [Methylobacterium sp. A49B]
MHSTKPQLERSLSANPLIRKLRVAGSLTDEDRTVLEGLCVSPRHLEARQHIISQGDPPSDVHLVLDGLACRYKVTPDGSRQIVAVMVPGDFCDLHIAILGEMDHGIATLSPCTIVDIPVATIADLTENHPRIRQTLWWATLVDEATLREWLVNLGQREAAQRMSRFFCELLIRLQLVGWTEENSYAWPLRKYDLADLLGLTSVHVNRTLQYLRGQGLIVMRRQRLIIPDVDRLKAFCSFDPTYLHLASPRSVVRQ